MNDITRLSMKRHWRCATLDISPRPRKVRFGLWEVIGPESTVTKQRASGRVQTLPVLPVRCTGCGLEVERDKAMLERGKSQACNRCTQRLRKEAAA